MATTAGVSERQDRDGRDPLCTARRLLTFGAALTLGALSGACASVFHPVDADSLTDVSSVARLAVAPQGAALAVVGQTLQGATTGAAPTSSSSATSAAGPVAGFGPAGGEDRQGRALRLMREYAQACSVADARGHLDLAERACRWSLAAAEAAPADPLLISQSQYQIGQVMRRRGQFGRAETHFQAALAIEFQQPVVSSQRVGARLIELAAVQAGQRRWQRGRRTLEKALPYSNHLFGSQRAYAAEVYSRYSAHLRSQPGTDAQAASRFEARALALR